MMRYCTFLKETILSEQKVIYERKNPKIFLEDILESINRIEKYVKGKTKEEFLDNHEKQDAIIKRLEVIGEAVKIFHQK